MPTLFRPQIRKVKTRIFAQILFSETAIVSKPWFRKWSNFPRAVQLIAIENIEKEIIDVKSM